MNLNFRWVRKTGDYSSGESLYLNRIALGSYAWNISLSRDLPQAEKDAHQYIGSINLPSIQTVRVYGAEPEIVKAQLEKKAAEWFIEALKGCEINVEIH